MRDKIGSRKTERSLCVFCGSSFGRDPAYRDLAQRLGRALVAQDIALIYGGGRVGLMGAVAETVLFNGGHVVGIIPQHLKDAEVGFDEVSELIVVEDMHRRKRIMFDRSDAFCVLPGGFGTLDETFEILTWKLLGLHDKPIVLVNLAGYWTPWLAVIDGIIREGFARPQSRQLFSVVESVEDVLSACFPAGLAAHAEAAELF